MSLSDKVAARAGEVLALLELGTVPLDQATGHALVAMGLGILRIEGVPSDQVRELVDETLTKADCREDAS